ncbi:MAG: hypothetical protein IT363_04595 [Methanoregulaceae archaeon]|nr:hypothetical protein [Methanoregulaceae archaeon]
MKVTTLLGCLGLVAAGNAQLLVPDVSRTYANFSNGVAVSNGQRSYYLSPAASGLRVHVLGDVPGGAQTFDFPGLPGVATVVDARMGPDGFLYALGAQRLVKISPDGSALVWSAPVSGVSSELEVLGSRVYVMRSVNLTAFVTGFDAGSGAANWQSGGFGYTGSSNPHFDIDAHGGVIILRQTAASEHRIVAVPPAGGSTLVWSRTFTGLRGFDGSGPVLVATAATLGTTLTLIDSATGATLKTATHANVPPGELIRAGQRAFLARIAGSDQTVAHVDVNSLEVIDQSFALDPGVAEALRSRVIVAGMPLWHSLDSENGFDFFDRLRASDSGLEEVLRRGRLLSVAADATGKVVVAVAPNRLERFDARPLNSGHPTFRIPFDQLTLSVPAPGLRASFLYEEGAALTLTQQAQHGTVTLENDGSFIYRANDPKHIVDEFRVEMRRGSLTSLGVVRIVRHPKVSEVTLSSVRVKGGVSVIGRLRMTGPAVGGDQVEPLSENTTATALSTQTALIRQGSDLSEPFTVFTARVPQQVVASITGGGQKAFLTVEPPFVSSLVAGTPTTLGGAKSPFTVFLDSPAPTNGITIQLSGSTAFGTVPSTIFIPNGATTGSFLVSTGTPETFANLAASATANGTTRSASIRIVSRSVTLVPTSVIGGTSAVGSIKLGGAVVGSAISFSLSDNSFATAPSPQNVALSVGSQSGGFTVLTVAVPVTLVSTITASSQGLSLTASVTVRAPLVTSISMNPTSVRGGFNSTGTVTITGPAPTAGLVVSLTSASSLVTVPSSITIQPGVTTGSFTARSLPTGKTLMIVMTARTGSVTRSTTLIITP